MKTLIFINYRQADTAALADHLERAFQVALPEGAFFRDTKDIEYGDSIPEEIEKHLSEVRVILSLIGAEWHKLPDPKYNIPRLLKANDWVRKELEYAKAHKLTVLPILYNRPPINDINAWLEECLPNLSFIPGLKRLEIREDSLQADLDNLLEYLKREFGIQLLNDRVPALSTEENLRKALEKEFPLPLKYKHTLAPAPFKKLDYFKQEDAPLFFGRTEKILALCRAIGQYPLNLLYGRSGVGKSSLLNAGVLPRLEERYDIVYLRRDREKSYPLQIEELEAAGGRQRLLVLDQAEEMYTHPRADKTQEIADFFTGIARLCLQENSRVLLCFRSEYQPEMLQQLRNKGFFCTREQEHFLQKLDRAGIRDAIGGVAADQILSNQYKLEIEEELATALCEDLLRDELQDSHIAPLLQYHLHALWEDAYTQRRNEYDMRPLRKARYLKLQQAGIEELIQTELNKLRPDYAHHLDSGLVWDLLRRYTTEELTAGGARDTDILASYQHIPDMGDFLHALKQRTYLLLPAERLDADLTRLAHDALAPILRSVYNNSDLPGQRAWRIVESRERDIQSGRDPHFSETDLSSIDEGASAMKQLSPDIEKRLQIDRQRYAEQKRQNFELAMQKAVFEHEHLNYAESLRNLKLAAGVGLDIEGVGDLALELLFPLELLKDEARLDECRRFLQDLGRTDTYQEALLQRRYFPEVVPIPAGKFMMGDVMGDDHYNDEKPLHEVTLDAFSLGAASLSAWQYGIYCLLSGKKLPFDSGFGRGDRPVIYVNWYEAVAYCNWLSLYQGLEPVYEIQGESVSVAWDKSGYRLPTEAEWEYAAREGGQAIRFGNGKNQADPREINFDAEHEYNERHSAAYTQKGTARGATLPVRSFAPNALGLYDMSGNVFDWCWDWYDPAYYGSGSPAHNPPGPDKSPEGRRVIRGGSWYNASIDCRCSSRFWYNPFFRAYGIGFRLSRR